MKKSFITLALAAFSLCPSQMKAQQNPILPGFHADPEITYSNQTHRYYIYSTTDGTPGWGGYTYQCFSSADLKEWRDEGEVLNAKNGQIAWADGNLWAPAVQEVKVGKGKYKYYLYYSVNPKAGGGKQIGVQSATAPQVRSLTMAHLLSQRLPKVVRDSRLTWTYSLIRARRSLICIGATAIWLVPNSRKT